MDSLTQLPNRGNGKPDAERVQADANYQKSKKTLEHRVLLMMIKSSAWYHKMKTRISPVLPDGRTRREDFEQPDYNLIWGLVAQHLETTPGSESNNMSLTDEDIDLIFAQNLAQDGGPGLTADKAREILDWLKRDLREITIDPTLYETLPDDANFSRWLEERVCEFHSRRIANLSTAGRAPRLEDFQQAELQIRTTIFNGHSRLSVRRPSQIIAMNFDPNDVILGNGLWSRGQMLGVIGAPEVGKSRWVTQLIATMKAGKPFLGFSTHGRDLRWLVLQTENSNRRLKDEFMRLVPLFDSPEDWIRFDQEVFFHSLENEMDGLVMLNNPEAAARVSNLIQDVKPDCIVIDPLRDFGFGNLDRDESMTATLHTLSRICRQGDPTRSLLIIHHARTGREAASGAVGFDKGSFGRNSKALFGYVRGQINIAPAVPDNSKLIIACGKSNDGPQFPAFGVKRNDRMLYELDPDIDIEVWLEEMKTGRPPKITSEEVVELCRERPLSESDLLGAIQAAGDCSPKTAGRALNRAGPKLQYDPKTQLYSPRAIQPAPNA